jgi:uncharacterized damage-inducible protein DinB
MTTKNKAMTELENITTLLKNTYENNPWYGPPVKDAIQGITQEQALKKLENTHTIIELVSHMTSWRIYAINKLTGNTNFKMTEDLNFPSETNWKNLVIKLEESQSELLASIEKFPEKKLHDDVPSTHHVYTYSTLLHGIIHHDIYHTGQIMIIRKHFNF